ncbi:Dyp-type peroxidase [Phytoactinopolyspora mesophila]|uniref:Dyp-type peroxidase n=1 Tax=Phytoactinopolyspora mesophila TaxID=2650750 RepID=A0A7K3M986_9ACTN|nr:Dyp-type peroxidase [Phytoactinopolyspora mesophila]NDL59844.1 Dyp-type peroxidase [Phytoactinopolyspora mesophila]
MPTTTDRDRSAAARGGLSRRGLLTAGASGLVGASAVGVPMALASSGTDTAAGPDDALGRATVPFHGVHQAGIATPAQAFATFIAFDLAPDVDRDALGRWMRLWTGNAERLTQGRPALADTDPELARAPSQLTITVGVGPGFLAAAGREDEAPPWLRPLPEFTIDRLESAWSDGDLVVQICADDPVAISHASRMLTKDARAFAGVRWVQAGFRHASGVTPPGATPRNLMGQLDGTTNAEPGTEEFDHQVWIDDGPDWLRGGSSLVLRRIRIEMDTWDMVGRQGKEETIGRRLDDGAPLGGEAEHDEPDFDAVNEIGLTVIPDWSHIRRARPDDPRQRVFRRSYNYDDGPAADGESGAGMLFVSYQADIDAQFIPIQRRLDELDLLNEWTTPIGSAVFAILPGCRPGGWLGEALLD